jgi:hypothetical protein
MAGNFGYDTYLISYATDTFDKLGQKWWNLWHRVDPQDCTCKSGQWVCKCNSFKKNIWYLFILETYINF